MATLSEIQARIDEIDALLASGIKSTSIGDRRIDYDLEALRRERSRLASIVASQTAGGGQFRRVVFKSG